MSGGITEDDEKLIDAKLTITKGEILDKVTEMFSSFREEIQNSLKLISDNLVETSKITNKNYNIITELKLSIKGNGTIGLKDRVVALEESKKKDDENKEKEIEKRRDRKFLEQRDNKSMKKTIITAIISSSGVTAIITAVLNYLI